MGLRGNFLAALLPVNGGPSRLECYKNKRKQRCRCVQIHQLDPHDNWHHRAETDQGGLGQVVFCVSPPTRHLPVKMPKLPVLLLDVLQTMNTFEEVMTRGACGLANATISQRKSSDVRCTTV